MEVLILAIYKMKKEMYNEYCHPSNRKRHRAMSQKDLINYINKMGRLWVVIDDILIY